MSTVRGKAALKVTRYSEVHANSYSQEITIHASGWDDSRKQFSIEGTLSVHCAKNLTRELRKGLRKIRDEATSRLQQVVIDAEGPL